MGVSFDRERVARWIDGHWYSTGWIVVAPIASSVWAARAHADWVVTTLIALTGPSWSGVLLPGVVRHVATNVAGVVATLSGGLLALFLGDAASRADKAVQPEIAGVFATLVIAGAASQVGQVHRYLEQRRGEQELIDRLDAAREIQTMILAEMRAEPRQVPDAPRRGRRRRWHHR